MSAIKILKNDIEDQKEAVKRIAVQQAQGTNQTIRFYRNLISMKRQLDAVYGLTECLVDPGFQKMVSDFEKNQDLYVGLSNEEISVMYAVNKECDEEYESGNWKYPNCEYRVIHRLCVNPKYQNKGIAKETLSHIEKELQKQNVEAIRLDVFSQNPFALSLYYNCGYEKVGFADWRKGRFYLMEKHL